MKIRQIVLKTLLLLLVLMPAGVSAQVLVEARIDTADILIGEQVQLKVKCSVNAGQKVTFPYYQAEEEIVGGVEVIDNGKIDTVLIDNAKRMELTRAYTITSFDSALYSIPPVAVNVDGKEYASKARLGLKVSSVPVDTVHVDKFSGPHGVVEQEFAWDWRITRNALIALLAACCFLALVTRLSDPRLITRRKVVYPPVPAHVTAIGEMKHISEVKADEKAYYTRLTETLRTYIEKRFGFDATKMTTAEIVDKLYETENAEAMTELKGILQTADLVKFANMKTSVSEQDRSLVEALNYVQTTKLVPAVEPKPHIEYVTLSGRKQRWLRLLMGTGAVASALVVLGLTAYVIYDLYRCFA